MSAKRAKNEKKEKVARKERKVFNIYNLLVLISIVIILGAGYVLLERQGVDVVAEVKQRLPEDWFKEKKPETTNNNKTVTPSKSPVNTQNFGNKATPVPTQNVSTTSVPTSNTGTSAGNIVSSGVASGEEISEDKAAEIAIAQFSQMGETGLQKNEMEIMQIQRSGELYYYISSPENTAEIKIKGGKITRLNSVLVDR